MEARFRVCAVSERLFFIITPVLQHEKRRFAT